LKPYVDKVVAGQETFSGKENHCILLKHLVRPQGKIHSITKESMPYHIQAARNAILLYIKETGNADFVDGKMIFYRPNFRGKTRHTVWTPFGIVAHFVPNTCKKTECPL
jgi:hypothetical protein